MCASDVITLIGLWPSRAALAQDVSVAEDPVSVDRVHKWARAGAIPARFHGRVLRAGQVRGFPLTADDLVRLHDRPLRDDARAA